MNDSRLGVPLGAICNPIKATMRLKRVGSWSRSAKLHTILLQHRTVERNQPTAVFQKTSILLMWQAETILESALEALQKFPRMPQLRSKSEWVQISG